MRGKTVILFLHADIIPAEKKEDRMNKKNVRPVSIT